MLVTLEGEAASRRPSKKELGKRAPERETRIGVRPAMLKRFFLAVAVLLLVEPLLPRRVAHVRNLH